SERPRLGGDASALQGSRSRPLDQADHPRHSLRSVLRGRDDEARSREEARAAYAELDEQVISVVRDALDSGPVPDVLTVYLSGTDLYAHVATEGPDAARRAYLHEVVDPQLG